MKVGNRKENLQGRMEKVSKGTPAKIKTCKAELEKVS
jgi:hypothetical protein